MLSLRTTIGFATPSDLVEIGELSRRDIEHGLGWKYTPTRLRLLVRDATKNVVVARSGAALVGFGVMTYREETANLDLLAVKAQYRRRGAGKQIVAWLETVALNAGISVVYLQVRSTNLGAIRFYEALGFQVIDQVPGYYLGQEAASIMSRSIRNLVDEA